jgi:hypothetical protein
LILLGVPLKLLKAIIGHIVNSINHNNIRGLNSRWVNMKEDFLME